MLASYIRALMTLNAATTPTPEQTYAVSTSPHPPFEPVHHCAHRLLQAMAPDIRRRVDQNRAARLAMENETRKQMEAQVPSMLD